MTTQTDHLMHPESFSKVLHIGLVPLRYEQRQARLFCKVQYKDGRLSITGVIGPQSNGDALGSCGQIDGEFWHRNPAHNDSRTIAPIHPHEMTFAPGWDMNYWLNFLDVWAEWHLNNMRPNCEHQIGWGDQEITLVKWHLNVTAIRAKARIENAVMQRLLAGEAVQLTPDWAAALGAKYEIVLPVDFDPPCPWYKVAGRETKRSGWVHPSEHPAGVLGKACPVCGYKYGSRWLTQPVPDAVLDFLYNLPDADRQPAWI